MKAFIVFIAILFTLNGFAEDKKLGLKHESTLSYVQTAGNSEATTSSFNQMTGYWWTKDILQLTGHYLSTNTATTDNNNVTTNLTTAENWAAKLRYDKILVPDRFNIYASHGWRGDRFQNVREGHDTDIGGEYFWIKDDSTTFSSGLGYRYTKELLLTAIPAGKPQAGKIHPEYNFLQITSKFECKHSKAFTFGAYAEYLPSFEDFTDDYRVNFGPYIVSTLSDMFSLKVAYDGKYRNIPAKIGLERLDTTFTTSIIAKY